MPKRPPIFKPPGSQSRTAIHRAHNQQRANDPDYQARRKLYASSAWKNLRLAKLARAPLCEHCQVEGGRVTAAAHVDHKIPMHAGGPSLPDLNGLMSLCHGCHSRKTAAERTGRWTIPVRGCDADGIPLDPEHPWRKELNAEARANRDEGGVKSLQLHGEERPRSRIRMRSVPCPIPGRMREP